MNCWTFNMPDIESSQFNSFLFWKLPIPEMDPRELALTLAPAMCRSQRSVATSANGGATSHARPTPPHKLPLTLDQAPKSEFGEFTCFTYWRSPVEDVHDVANLIVS